MKAVPEKWTHHHTHRLYHLAQAVCASFILLILVSAFAVELLQVRADNSVSQDLTLSAIVEQINPGPTVVAIGIPPAANQPPPQPAPDQPHITNPRTTITPPADADPQQMILPDGRKTLVYQFSTAYPQFSGTTNIPRALIFLQIHSDMVIRATTIADDRGYWQWTSPAPITSGFHNLAVIAQDPNDSRIRSEASLNFFIKAAPKESVVLTSPGFLEPAPGNQGNLFDVFVKIPDKLKQFPPGDELIAQIKLINFGSPGNAVDVPVTYTIEDSSHKVIMQRTETVAVATQLSLLKTFYTSPTLPEGVYTLIVRAPTKDAIALASDTFELKGSAVIALSEVTRIDFSVLFQAFIALLVVFIIITYFEYNRVAVLSQYIKRVDETGLGGYAKH